MREANFQVEDLQAVIMHEVGQLQELFRQQQVLEMQRL